MDGERINGWTHVALADGRVERRGDGSPQRWMSTGWSRSASTLPLDR